MESSVSGTSSSFRLLAALALAVLAVPLLAQTTYPIEGYISGIHPPMGFEVNGRRFEVTSETSFGLIGSGSTSTASPLRESPADRRICPGGRQRIRPIQCPSRPQPS
jgi:hypothetical protein